MSRGSSGGRRLLLVALCACGPAEEAPRRARGELRFDGPPPRDLLFLSIDTLRADAVATGDSAGAAPFLEELARTGVRLERHQQCSAWTLPGMACTLTGRDNLDLGHAPRPGGELGPGVRLAGEVPTIAAWLSARGHDTALVGSNLWLTDPAFGVSGGYRVVEHGGGSAIDVRERGLDWLSGTDGPWFLHLHHMEPHAPYLPDEDLLEGWRADAWPQDLRDPAVQEAARAAAGSLDPEDRALLAELLRALYLAEVRTLDRRLADTWEALDAGGWLDDALVVVWSDHGEQLLERGWSGHAHSLHAEENDALALFWAKNLLEPGPWTAPTDATDLVPTALAALGHPIPRDLTGVVLGEADPARPRYAEVLGYGGTALSVTVEGARVIHHVEDGLVAQFDRDADPAERSPVPVDPALEALLAPRVDRLAELLGEP